MRKQGSKSLNKGLGAERVLGGIKKRRQGGAAAWSLLDLGPQFLFESDQGVTQSGGLATQWNDLSGNGYHATAAGAQRPTYNSSALNSLPSLSFPASTWLDFGGSTAFFTAGSNYTLIALVRSPAFSGTEYRLVGSVNSAATNRRLVLMHTNDAAYGDINFSHTGNGGGGGATGTVRATGSLSTASGLILDYNGGTATSAASWELRKNNSVLTDSVGANSQTLGNNSKIGSWYDGGLNFIGEIFTFCGIARSLTSDERVLVTDYFTAKWGI